MKYTIKAGVLYKNESQLALVRIKSALLGPQRKILSIAGELLLTADARYLDESKASSGDVRNREYLLTDNENQLVGSARPGYVDGDDPNVVGWPICRMPRVDHANIVVNGEEYLLTMHNSQNYSLINATIRRFFVLCTRVLQEDGLWKIFAVLSRKLFAVYLSFADI